jgi:hypothetical protein
VKDHVHLQCSVSNAFALLLRQHLHSHHTRCTLNTTTTAPLHHCTTAPLHHQEPAKMHIFLSFLFSMDNVNVWMKDEWLRLYDREFVENTLIAKYVY